MSLLTQALCVRPAQI